MHTRARTWLTATGLAALLAVLALRASGFVADEVDDIYIDMLHARNLVEHGVLGLDWKSAPTEGISSPLNVGLHALCFWLGIDALVAVKLRVFVCACLAVVATFLLLRRVSRNAVLPWIGAALLVLSPAYAYWSVAGVETPIYALLLLLAVDWLARPNLSLRSAAALGLLAIARPEGPMFAVIGVAFVALRMARHGRPSGSELRRFAAWLVLLAVIAMPYQVFRWTYFHAIFPNTYYAKINEHVNPWRGVLYVWEFVRDSAPWLIAIVPLAWFARRGRDGLLALAWSFVLAQTAVTVRAAGDWMPHYRFGVHILPLATIITLCSLDDLLELFARERSSASSTARSDIALAPHAQFPWRALAGRLVLSAGSLGGCFWLVREAHAAPLSLDLVPHEAILGSAVQYRRVAERIRSECAVKHVDPGDVLVALEPVGIVPFFARTRVLDLSGKADRAIGSAALRFGKGREREKDLWVAGLVFERMPDYFCVSGGMNPGHQYATAADPRFPLWYELIATIDTLTVYARRAAPLVLPELHVVNRMDGVQLLEPATGRLAPVTLDVLTTRIPEALARGDKVLLHVEFDSPLSRLEPLLDLANVRMDWREAGRYYRTVALEAGENRMSVLLEHLPLNDAAPFQDGGPLRSIDDGAPPDLRIDCSAGEDRDLLVLQPFDVSGARIGWIEARMKLDRQRGADSGLFWSLHRSLPGPGSAINNGSAIVHDDGEGWREVGVLIRIPPGATHLQVGFGGFRNDGSVLRVRDTRILVLARDPPPTSR